jgi:hypothetical protein
MSKQIKPVKGYAYLGFFETGWKKDDSAIFVYRKKNKTPWAIPVLISPIINPKKNARK